MLDGISLCLPNIDLSEQNSTIESSQTIRIRGLTLPRATKKLRAGKMRQESE